MLVDVIVEGCNSQELRRKILEKDQSLREIESLGESLESVRLQEKELKSGNEGGQSEVFKIQKSEPRAGLKTRSERKQDKIVRRFSGGRFLERNEAAIICFACGQYGHMSKTPSCPARGKTCRRCQKSGHFEKVCRKRPYDSQVTQYTRKVHSVEDNDATPELSVSSGDSEKKVYYTFYTGNDTNSFECKIGGISTAVFIDSGSEVNLITVNTKGSNKVLKAYGCNEPLRIVGTFEASVEIDNRSTEAEFIVTEEGQRNLLGDSTSKQLGILKIGLEINQVNKDWKLVPFSKIAGIQVRIQMDPTVTPVHQPLRRVPIPLESAVNEKLDELLAREIIEVKRGLVSWVSPLVVANKANGQIRLCVDLRRVNQAVIRDRHTMPVIDDVLTKIGKGNVWSVLDVKDAFFQLELEEESRDATVFITHRCLYRFKRLPFGLVSAPEIFQRTMDEILVDCEGAYWYLDDVGVEGKTLDEHDKRLNEVSCNDVG
ncbi:uncharacterized protein K02A2.6-like [Ochlerotatus camptorhynchus]|uniref:uncharacterized protein K02A2.6-like n=1 Tax=Ochlerotatus camptorhynchus TaxID=644619 RepID=UPI0031CEA884